MSFTATLETSIAIGICLDHEVEEVILLIPVTASPNALSLASNVNAVGDICISSCGEWGMIVTGSVVSIVEGRSKAIEGSLIFGLDANLMGIIVTGVPTSLMGG